MKLKPYNNYPIPSHTIFSYAESASTVGGLLVNCFAVNSLCSSLFKHMGVKMKCPAASSVTVLHYTNTVIQVAWNSVTFLQSNK